MMTMMASLTTVSKIRVSSVSRLYLKQRDQVYTFTFFLEDDDDDGDGILDLDEDYDVRDNLNNLFLGLSTSFLRNFKMLLAPRIFRQI